MVTAVFIHLVGLAFNVAGIMRSGQRPQVLVYAFIIDVALRLLTLRVTPRALAAYISAPPAPGQTSAPFVDEQTHQPATFPAYVIVVTMLAGFGFILANVNAQKQLDLDPNLLAADLRWGLLLALVYWLQALAARTITIDPSATLIQNLGYNTRDIVILALAVLGAGGAVAARQTWGLTSSGWTVLGPLLAVRFLFDLGRVKRQ
jgi:hypothetical protein